MRSNFESGDLINDRKSRHAVISRHDYARMRRVMFRRSRHWKQVAILIGIVLPLAYLPTLQHAAFTLGVIHPKLSGVDIRMHSGWYPEVSNETSIGKLLLSTDLPELVVAQTAWPWPGARSRLIVVKRNDAQSLVADSARIASLHKYSWGEVVFLKIGIAVSPSLGLVFSTKSGDLEELARVLNSVESIVVKS